jgi:hypothetical protein
LRHGKGSKVDNGSSNGDVSNKRRGMFVDVPLAWI